MSEIIDGKTVLTPDDVKAIAGFIPQVEAEGAHLLLIELLNGNPAFTSVDSIRSTLIALSQKGQPGGVASLGQDGVVPPEQLPGYSLVGTYIVESEGEMIGLTQARQGDLAIRNDNGKIFILGALPPTEVDNWIELTALGSLLGAHTARTDNPHSVTKAQVGLGDVDNTKDADKPVSTAQGQALEGLAGAGRTTETIKKNADDIKNLAGSGRTTETVKQNAQDIAAAKGSGWTNQTIVNNASAILALQSGKLDKQTFEEHVDQELLEDSDVKHKSLTLTEKLETVNLIMGDFNLSEMDMIAWHKNNFRGKIFENGLTQDHWSAISNRTYKDLYVGDKIKGASGQHYFISDIEYYRNTGSTNTTTPHLVLVPDTVMAGGDKQMNTTNVTSTGYKGSAMFSYTDGNIKTAHDIIMSDFSGHMLQVERYLSTSHTTGEWTMRYDDLMNEAMVYGTIVNGGASQLDFGLRNIGAEKSQLALFRLRHDLIGIRAYYWLRDIVSSSHFALVDSFGAAASDDASNGPGVRPDFCVKA